MWPGWREPGGSPVGRPPGVRPVGRVTTVDIRWLSFERPYMTRRRAFTLIEVLVVVAIIGLLVAIAAPSISEARRISKRTFCAHSLHQIGVGLESYLSSRGKDVFPYLCRMPSYAEATTPSGSQRLLSLPEGLAPELGAKSKVFECPADIVTESPMASMDGPTPPVPFGPRVGGRWFDSEGTSYEWTEQANGLHRRTKKVTWRDIPIPLKDLPIVFDFEPFHGTPRQRGRSNTLYADLRVVTD